MGSSPTRTTNFDMTDSTKIKYLVFVTCDHTSTNYNNVNDDCVSRFPNVGELVVENLKQLHKELKDNGWGHHGWDYWRCPECEKL